MTLGKTLILGNGRHGKDTVAELLAKKTGMTFNSSSLAALDVIWPSLRVACDYVCSKEYAYSSRHKHRPLWKELITLYNTPDKAALAKLILSQCDMYVGMRCKEEFAVTKHLFDTIIWVDASDRHPPEETMTIEYESGMFLIDNNGTLNYLEGQVDSIIDLYV